MNNLQRNAEDAKRDRVVKPSDRIRELTTHPENDTGCTGLARAIVQYLDERAAEGSPVRIKTSIGFTEPVAMDGTAFQRAATAGPDSAATGTPAYLTACIHEYRSELGRMRDEIIAKGRELAAKNREIETLQETIKSLESANAGLLKRTVQQVRQRDAALRILQKSAPEFCEQEERV